MPASHTAAFYLAPAVKVAGSDFPALSWNGTAARAAKLTDVYYGGRYRIAGTVKIKGTPDAPVKRRVRLLRDRDGIVIREMWSDPATGAYSFDNIDGSEKYTVISYDYTFNFRAVVSDNLTPEAMP